MSANDERSSFEQHIKPLFRDHDRQSMEWAFDLWSHNDVARNSDPLRSRFEVELAIVEYIAWFNDTRLHWETRAAL